VITIIKVFNQVGHKPGKPVVLWGILWTWKTRGIFREFCAMSEKLLQTK